MRVLHFVLNSMFIRKNKLRPIGSLWRPKKDTDPFSIAILQDNAGKLKKDMDWDNEWVEENEKALEEE